MRESDIFLGTITKPFTGDPSTRQVVDIADLSPGTNYTVHVMLQYSTPELISDSAMTVGATLPNGQGKSSSIGIEKAFEPRGKWGFNFAVL